MLRRFSNLVLIATVLLTLANDRASAENAVLIEILKISNEGFERSGNAIVGRKKVLLNSHEIAHVFQQNQLDLQFLNKRATEGLVRKITAKLRSNPGRAVTACEGKTCLTARAAK